MKISKKKEKKIRYYLERNFFSGQEIAAVFNELKNFPKILSYLFSVRVMAVFYVALFISSMFFSWEIFHSYFSWSYNGFGYSGVLLSYNPKMARYAFLVVLFLMPYALLKISIFSIPKLRKFQLCLNMSDSRSTEYVHNGPAKKSSHKISRQDFEKKSLQGKLLYIYFRSFLARKPFIMGLAIFIWALGVLAIVPEYYHYVVTNDKVIYRNAFTGDKTFALNEVKAINTGCHWVSAIKHGGSWRLYYQLDFGQEQFNLLERTFPASSNINALRALNNKFEALGIYPQAKEQPTNDCLQHLRDLYPESAEVIKIMGFQ